MMRRESFYAVFLLIFVTVSPAAEYSCSKLHADYKKAEKEYVRLQKSEASGKELYASVNRYIDTATALLAYCKVELKLDKQYRLQSVLKKSDRERAGYFVRAVREYHREYGIRPKVQEFYQEGLNESRRRESAAPPSPSRQPLPPVRPSLPPIQQPQLPPVSR